MFRINDLSLKIFQDESVQNVVWVKYTNFLKC